MRHDCKWRHHISQQKQASFTKLPRGEVATRQVKTCPEVGHNLFSVKQAVRNGYEVVLTEENPHVLHAPSGTRIPIAPKKEDGWYIKLALVNSAPTALAMPTQEIPQEDDADDGTSAADDTSSASSAPTPAPPAPPRNGTSHNPAGSTSSAGGEQKNKKGTAGASASTGMRKKKKIKPVKVRNPVARSLQHRRWAHALPRRLHTTAKSDRVTGLTWV